MTIPADHPHASAIQHLDAQAKLLRLQADELARAGGATKAERGQNADRAAATLIQACRLEAAAEALLAI